MFQLLSIEKLEALKKFLKTRMASDKTTYLKADKELKRRVGQETNKKGTKNA